MPDCHVGLNVVNTLRAPSAWKSSLRCKARAVHECATEQAFRVIAYRCNNATTTREQAASAQPFPVALGLLLGMLGASWI